MSQVDDHRPLSVGAYLSMVISAAAPGPGRTFPLTRVRGLALARDVCSPVQSPAFENSAMDGFAVRRCEVQSVPTTLPVTADVVVLLEWTDGGDERVMVLRCRPINGDHCRTEEDLRTGLLVLEHGTNCPRRALK